jgi:ABC-type multidrug transport system fused ATPase/permease subunit
MHRFFSMALTFGSELIVSIERIQDFLSLEEVGSSKSFIQDLSEHQDISDNVLCLIENASFRWPKKKMEVDESENRVVNETYILNDISLKLKRGEITGVCGEVGSGKSSLALAILQEMELCNGTCSIRKDIKIAYCSQIPWIIQGTIEENILFGSTLRKEWLKRVISVCQLDRDVASFPAGLSTLIGERGVLLSGGQRARLQLARAVYADADLYILDDPLSACDAIVGKSLFRGCIKDFLLNPESHGLTGRTFLPAIMLITHQIQFVKPCDNVVILSHGRILSQGSFLDAINSSSSKSADRNEFVVSMEQFLIKASMNSLNSRKGVDAIPPNDENNSEGVTQGPETEREKEKATEDMGAPELVSAEGEVSWNTYISFFSTGITPPVFAILLFLMVREILILRFRDKFY